MPNLWDEAYNRYNGPLPEGERERIYAATHPKRGTRAYTIEAWGCVRFLGHRALHAKRAHDLLELGKCEHWLDAALDTWKDARRAEGK